MPANAMTYDSFIKFLRKLIQTTAQGNSPFYGISSGTAIATVAGHYGTILPPVKSEVAIAWRTVGRFGAKRSVSWETRTALVTQKSSHFKVVDHVTTSVAISWNLEQRFFKQKQIRFRDLTKVRTFSIGGIRFNCYQRVYVKDWQLVFLSPGNISTGLVHPIDYSTPNLQPKSYKGLGTPVVNPIDYDNYPGYGQMPLPGITFRVDINPSGRVTCQSAVAFRDMIKVSATKKSTWELITRKHFIQPIQFNNLLKVTNSTIMEWNIGNWVSSHIRQTAQRRIDFAY